MYRIDYQLSATRWLPAKVVPQTATLPEVFRVAQAEANARRTNTCVIRCAGSSGTPVITCYPQPDPESAA